MRRVSRRVTLIAYCRLAISSRTRSQSGGRSTEAADLVRNEREAECFRGVEIAQRFDLDRVYNREISGWQSLEESSKASIDSYGFRLPKFG